MTTKEKVHRRTTAIKSSTLAPDLFWLGFIIYAASFSISTTDQVNYIICNIFQILGLCMILPATVFLIRLKIENNYLRVVYFIYILWLILTVIRGIKFDYLTIKQMLFDPNSGLFLYLTPIVMLMTVDTSFLKKAFQAIVVLGVIYLFYDLLFIRDLLFPVENMRSQAIFEYFTQQLSLAGGFILLTYIYHTKKMNFFILFTMAVTFMLAVIRARRGLIFMTFSMFFFTYIIFQYFNKRKVVNIILSMFLITILTFIAISIYNENRKDTFGLITERIGQHTRTEVEKYFYRDMKPNDWLVGKGLNGEYFCPGVTEGIGRITIYRKVVETGYLQVILNGGIVSVILLLLIAIPAIIKGIFFSNNILSKAAGIWIFLFLLYMYPGTITKFSMHYMLVWISIGICYSGQIRNMTDDYIADFLKPVLLKKSR